LLDMSDGPALSIVIPTLNERENVEMLVPALRRTLAGMGVRGEILVLDGGSVDGTAAAAEREGARAIQVGGGYGEAIRVGLREARGEYVVTMDADLSHQPEVVERLWSIRDLMTIGIASRYVPGGHARTSRTRIVLSRLLNVVFARGLSLPARDLSSGFRIYPRRAAQMLEPRANDFDILPEILVRAHSAGWRIVELPFAYEPRNAGASKARLLRLGRAYVRTFGQLWRLRNSIASADYDERAFDSIVPLQRYWQRRRHFLVTRAVKNGPVLDVGCGSSRILRDLSGVVGVDVSFPKLRYMSRYAVPLAQASIFALPFADGSFQTVVCSEVIEHVPGREAPLRELARVNKKGGTLVLGTPDYARFSWRAFEAMYRALAPGGYADEHITQYTHATLRELVMSLGYRHVRTDYVARSEMILVFERT
jgi:dolichol-phosphate mannosyltransferase